MASTAEQIRQQIALRERIIAEKQQELAAQQAILRSQQEDLSRAENARINASLALQRAQNTPGTSAADIERLRADVARADDAESQARIAAGRTSSNISSVEGSIRFNQSQLTQFQSDLTAVSAPPATAADPETNQQQVAQQPSEPPASAVNVTPQAPLSDLAVETPTAQTVTSVNTPVVDDPSANQFVFDENGEQVPTDSVQGQEILAEQNRVQQTEPALVDLENWRIEQNDGTGPGDIGSFYIVNQNGEIFRANIATRAEAEAALLEAQGAAADDIANTPVTDVGDVTAQNEDAEAEAAAREAARVQAAINERRRQVNQGDWRVKLRLAPAANYLYMAPNPGILQPLAVTDGIIFPYTPKIDLSYRAMYDVASLTHTNYNNYFYKSSLLDPVNLTATFTAQDTYEANYLLAVIHFFRSVTKMFYGQDPERGAPPPLVFFTGLGEYQFFEHPCLVHQFNYSLPSDVDYIRARSVMDPGADLQNRRSRQSVPSNAFASGLARLRSLGQNVEPGAEPKPPAPPTLGTNSPTYVPTRIDISLILYPVQSRSQVSNQFSLQQYANGDLLKGGFW